MLAPLISLNNFVTAAILGPLLLPVLYRRVKQWGLLYHDVMDASDLSRGRLPHLAHVVMVLALFGSLYVGVSISLGLNEEAARTIPLLFGLEITAPESLLMPAEGSRRRTHRGGCAVHRTPGPHNRARGL